MTVLEVVVVMIVTIIAVPGILVWILLGYSLLNSILMEKAKYED